VKAIETHDCKFGFGYSDLVCGTNAMTNSAAPSYAERLGLGGLSDTQVFIIDGWIAHIGGYPEYTNRFWNASMDLVVGGYGSLLNDRGPVTFSFDGEVIESKGYMEKERKPGIVKWLEALFCGLILRREDALELLIQVELEHVDAFPQNYPYYSSILDSFGGFVRGEAEWRAASQKKVIQEPKRVKPAFIRTWLTLFVMMEAIEEMDQAKFTDALEAALKAHKSFYGRGKDRNSANTVIAMGATAMAAVAFDRGLAIEVESGYLPVWMVENRVPEGDASTERAKKLAEEDAAKKSREAAARGEA